jgi:hypothetical protein
MNLPDVHVSRVDWHEAGAFSARREYLRVQRGPHVFDICAAVLSERSSFVSWWLCRPAPSMVVRILLFMLCVVGWVLLTNVVGSALPTLLRQTLDLGAPRSVVVFVFGVATWASMIIATIGTLVGLHIIVLLSIVRAETAEAIPGVGRLYHWLVSPTTYFRLDTAAMFASATHTVVLESLDSITEGKGVRALTEQERKPVMRGLMAA